jgi:FkbM family methyltransferase
MIESLFTIAKNIYGFYCVPISSDYTLTSKAILNGQVHEPDTIKFIADHCGNGHVIHAGAGFGDFLPALSKACHQKVWTFEPEIENYLCAQKTIELNELKNIEIYNCALGSKQEKLFLKVRQNHQKLGVRSEMQNPVEVTPSEDLQLTDVSKLDDLIPKDANISIIHLDVEGYEHEVLKGAHNIISQYAPLIILEIHSEALKYNDMMEKMNYLPFKHLIYDAGPMVFVNTVYRKAEHR